MSDAEQTGRPTLRVISGTATDEEIAAILAVMSTQTAAVEAAHHAAPDASVWHTPENGHRGTRARFAASRHGWRTSYWPR
jgi:hypothetical protein